MYTHKRYIVLLLILLFCINSLYSQERITEHSIKFRVNSASFESDYSDNASNLRKIKDFLQEIKKDSTTTILNVTFCGSASPEGSYQLNRRLASGRIEAIEEIVRSEVEIPDSIITRNDSYIPWNQLKEMMNEADIDHKEDVLSIIEEEPQLVDYHLQGQQIDSRIIKLRNIDGGKVWEQMNKLFFENMRNACVIIVTFRKAEKPETEQINVVPAEAPAEPVDEILEPQSEQEVMPTEGQWNPEMHLKTNLLGLSAAISNAAVEFDLTRHLSLALPVYYSAWDYFKSTLKFRTLAVQPELRCWISDKNDGFYIGAHFGLAYYNFAFDGDYRYQDHNMETPAIGGGIALGWRFPISKNERWRMEVSVGAGAYPIHYDMFHNTPVTKHGQLTKTVQSMYWGLDQAAVTLSYAFNLKKKGGRR